MLTNSDMSPNMMSVYEELTRSPQMGVLELSERVNLSVSTVRRILQSLEEKRLVRRYHGGAFIPRPSKKTEPPAVKRTQDYPEQKAAIAKEAAKHVAEGDCIMLTGGTTVASMCAFLKNIPDLTIVTDSLLVITESMFDSTVKLISLGGILNVTEQCFEGLLASVGVKQLRFNKIFHGIKAINPEDGFLTDDVRQVEFYRGCIKLASELFILATSHKFRQEGVVPLFAPQEVNCLITDQGAPENAVHKLEKQGCQVIRVNA